MKYRHEFSVRLHDVDAAGVMFFARLFVHAHDAYEDFMASQELALETLIAADMRLPLVHARADYLAPLRHGEEILVTLTIGKVGQTSFTVDYDFSREEKTCARVSTVHVLLDSDGNQPVPLPEHVRHLLQHYLSHPPI